MTTENTDNTDNLDEDVSGLKSKNADLLRKLKAAEARAEKAEEERDEATETAKADAGSELDKANRRIIKLEKDLSTANERADKSDKSLREYKATSALTSAIASANVDSKHVNMLTKALRADIEFDDEGEPTIEGKSIQDYAKSFFAKDGAEYVRAADHNGGGATGSGNSQARQFSKAPETPEELHKWMGWSANNKEEANALADEWKRADLRS